MRTHRTSLALGICLSLVARFDLSAAGGTQAPMAVPTMGIGLGGVSSYTSAWQFVDMMKYAREWRTPKGFEIVEDRFGWPVALKDALLSGPFGLMTRDVTVHRVAWTLH
jgi:hypothetical protein